jgi:hypothetical protein
MDYFKRAFTEGISRITNARQTPVVEIKTPVEELLFSFRECCRLIDHFASLDNADSLEADRSLHESKVRDHVKKVISILQEESLWWMSNKVDEINSSARPDEEATLARLPCIATLLKRRMIHELCTRAQRDLPRGCMP